MMGLMQNWRYHLTPEGKRLTLLVQCLISAVSSSAVKSSSRAATEHGFKKSTSFVGNAKRRRDSLRCCALVYRPSDNENNIYQKW